MTYLVLFCIFASRFSRQLFYMDSMDPHGSQRSAVMTHEGQMSIGFSKMHWKALSKPSWRRFRESKTWPETRPQRRQEPIPRLSGDRLSIPPVVVYFRISDPCYVRQKIFAFMTKGLYHLGFHEIEFACVRHQACESGTCFANCWN